MKHLNQTSEMDIPCCWTLISFVIATAFSFSYIFHVLRNIKLKFLSSNKFPETSTTTATTTTNTVTSATTSNLPLGTVGWPLLGETMEFISCAYSDHPESFMDKRRRLYGKVFKSHIFGKQTIISTDAEVNRFILQSDAKLFVPSYPKSLTELMGKSSILLINGSLQRRIHGLVGSFFKSSHLKAQITRDMQSYVQQAMDRWTNDCIHSPIFIQVEAKHIAFQVLVKALISLDPGEEMHLLKKQFQEFVSGLMSLPVNIPGTQLYRSLQAKKEMVKLVKKIIVTKRNDMVTAGADPNDVLDVLLSDQSGQLTDDLMSDNIVDMMIPGEDSVPLLITLAIKYLSDSPLALQKFTEENMKVYKLKAELREPMYWSDYLSLPFTQMIITETLRMGNIITGLMRKAMKDVDIKGYLIPKGWCVLTYLRSVHLDETLYDTPYQFNPWRWQDKDTNSSSFTPFGGGQRLCPGLDLARLEASIFLHHFVTHFRELVMSGRNQGPLDGFNDRRGYPSGGHIVRGPLLRPPPPLHPAVLEEEIEIQRGEMCELLEDNRRLAEDQVVLQRELGAARDELHRMNLVVSDMRGEHDARSRELIDKCMKLEADLLESESFKKEAKQLHVEAQKLEKIRQELVGQVQSFSKDWAKLQAESQPISHLRADIEDMQQELMRARTAIDYEKNAKIALHEQKQAMENNLISMAREVEKLRAEFTSINSRQWPSGANYGMTVGSPESGFPGHYGDPYGHQSHHTAPLYGLGSAPWAGFEKPRGTQR